jgi:hypothetical protein
MAVLIKNAQQKRSIAGLRKTLDISGNEINAVSRASFWMHGNKLAVARELKLESISDMKKRAIFSC